MSKAAIIILNKSNNKLLFDCISSIKNCTKTIEYHIYIGDTGSSKLELLEMQQWIKNEFSTTRNVTLINISSYNFAQNNNLIVNNFLKEEDIIVFCNNDVQLIDDCISEAVLEFQQNNNIGTIGFKLLFGDQTIQHAGQLLYLQNNKFSQITHRGLRHQKNQYVEKEFVVGNTGALMVTLKNTFKQIGGFNEMYIDCFEDVEYNLQCLLLQKQNLYIPKIAFHYESSTRNKNPKKIQQLQNDACNTLIPFINNCAAALQQHNLFTIINL